MKYLLTLFCCVCCLVCIVQSQTNFWGQLNLPPNPVWGGQQVQSIACNAMGDVFAGSGYGLIRSLDSGVTWTKVLSSGVYSIAITLDGTVFAGGSGVSRSTDNGESWQQGLPGIAVVSVAAKEDGHLVAGSFDGSIYQSSDGGQNWQKVNRRFFRGEYFFRLAAAPDGGFIAGTPVGRFYRSNNNGTTWVRRLGLRRDDRIVLTANSSGEVLAGGSKKIGNQVFAMLYRSVNSGGRFLKIAQFPGAILRSVVSDGSGNIFLGTESGIQYSSDHGTTWSLRNSGLADNVLTAVTLGPEGFVYTGAILGAMYRTTQVVPPSTVRGTAEQGFPEIPGSFALLQNYPNPFNPTTTIEFSLPVPAIVTLKVYNVLGQEMAELIHSELMDEGMQEVEFSATGGSASGGDASALPSGVYFYRLVAQGVANEETGTPGTKFVSVKKMMLVK